MPLVCNIDRWGSCTQIEFGPWGWGLSSEIIHTHFFNIMIRPLKMFGWCYPTDPILGADPRYFYLLFSCNNDKKQ